MEILSFSSKLCPILATPKLFTMDNDLFLPLCLPLRLTRSQNLPQQVPFDLLIWYTDISRLPTLKFTDPLHPDRSMTAYQRCSSLSLLGLISSQPTLTREARRSRLSPPFKAFQSSASCLAVTLLVPYPVLRPRTSLYCQGNISSLCYIHQAAAVEERIGR